MCRGLRVCVAVLRRSELKRVSGEEQLQQRPLVTPATAIIPSYHESLLYRHCRHMSRKQYADLIYQRKYRELGELPESPEFIVRVDKSEFERWMKSWNMLFN